ncbi:MAG TPA: ATP-binding protein [Sphingomicrobium sp.]
MTAAKPFKAERSRPRNAPVTPQMGETSDPKAMREDLDRFERSALTHLRLALLGVILRAIELAGDVQALLKAHPFISEYFDDLAQVTETRIPSAAAWRRAVGEWATGHSHLPLNRLKAAGIGDLAMEILLTLGFAEEDPRFVTLFGETSRLTVGMLAAMCRGGDDELRDGSVAGEVAHLSDLGMVTLHNGAGLRHGWEYGVVAEVWDGLAGSPRFPEGLVLTPLNALPDGASFVGPTTTFARPETLAALIMERQPILCLRGPSRNGRHLLASSVIKALGKPLLSLAATIPQNPSKWALAGVLACLHDAGIVIELALAPGEDQQLPAFPVGNPFLIIIAGIMGGIRSADRLPIVTVKVPAPDVTARASLWQHTAKVDGQLADQLARRFRLTSGNLVRAAEGAMFRSAPGALDPALVQEQVCSLQDARLETVARRVEPGAECDLIALDDISFDELYALASRCRHREELNRDDQSGMPGQIGVRALFAGPSGTGKTLASRWLARRLGKDIYRLDFAASVSKYIGETEKLLDRAFAAAEDLDCILLIDEGDALMAGRTAVGSANDRYANLETNFLLQRIESFEGILIVTTNASERIDKAFGRRMDAVVNFRAPDEMLRFHILKGHLGRHEASTELLEEIACRCALTGGQLHNIAQHARLLALDAGHKVTDGDLRKAITREYRKIDAHCPLKPQLAAAD